ncbi:MAG: hypothetical protein LBP64_00795 [Tannerella sp.]|jgi:hypothetical protein|nr:hypothetical protein [Tannerella sp.]
MVQLYLHSRYKKLLAKEVKCSLQNVYRALNGETETALAYHIRQRALEMGAVKLKKIVTDTPEQEQAKQ